MDRRVAVTGATGFIGGHVVHRLALEGWRPRILARRLPAHPLYRDLAVEAVIGSLADKQALARLTDGADAVVHLAGLVKAVSRAAFFAANAEGTERVLAASLAAPQRPRFLLISSLAAREPALSDYAASKRAAEQAVEGAGADLAWTILRPPAVYGPGDGETLAFFRTLKAGLAPLPAVAGARLSLIHATDLAAAAAAVLDAPATAGGSYELDDGRPGGYGWQEMAAAAAAALGVQPRILRIPPPLLRLAASANFCVGRLSGRPRMLTPGKAREMLHADWVCHDRRLQAAAGWAPGTGIQEGFAQTVAWYRGAGLL